LREEERLEGCDASPLALDRAAQALDQSGVQGEAPRDGGDIGSLRAQGGQGLAHVPRLTPERIALRTGVGGERPRGADAARDRVGESDEIVETRSVERGESVERLRRRLEIAPGVAVRAHAHALPVDLVDERWRARSLGRRVGWRFRALVMARAHVEKRL